MPGDVLRLHGRSSDGRDGREVRVRGVHDRGIHVRAVALLDPPATVDHDWGTVLIERDDHPGRLKWQERVALIQTLLAERGLQRPAKPADRRNSAAR